MAFFKTLKSIFSGKEVVEKELTFSDYCNLIKENGQHNFDLCVANGGTDCDLYTVVCSELLYVCSTNEVTDLNDPKILELILSYYLDRKLDKALVNKKLDCIIQLYDYTDGLTFYYNTAFVNDQVNFLFDTKEEIAVEKEVVAEEVVNEVVVEEEKKEDEVIKEVVAEKVVEEVVEPVKEEVVEERRVEGDDPDMSKELTDLYNNSLNALSYFEEIGPEGNNITPKRYHNAIGSMRDFINMLRLYKPSKVSDIGILFYYAKFMIKLNKKSPNSLRVALGDIRIMYGIISHLGFSNGNPFSGISNTNIVSEFLKKFCNEDDLAGYENHMDKRRKVSLDSYIKNGRKDRKPKAYPKEAFSDNRLVYKEDDTNTDNDSLVDVYGLKQLMIDTNECARYILENKCVPGRKEPSTARLDDILRSISYFSAMLKKRMPSKLDNNHLLYDYIEYLIDIVGNKPTSARIRLASVSFLYDTMYHLDKKAPNPFCDKNSTYIVLDYLKLFKPDLVDDYLGTINSTRTRPIDIDGSVVGKKKGNDFLTSTVNISRELDRIAYDRKKPAPLYDSEVNNNVTPFSPFISSILRCYKKNNFIQNDNMRKVRDMLIVHLSLKYRLTEDDIAELKTDHLVKGNSHHISINGKMIEIDSSIYEDLMNLNKIYNLCRSINNKSLGNVKNIIGHSSRGQEGKPMERNTIYNIIRRELDETRSNKDSVNIKYWLD